MSGHTIKFTRDGGFLHWQSDDPSVGWLSARIIVRKFVADRILLCTDNHDDLVGMLVATISYLEDDSRSERRRQVMLSEARAILAKLEQPQ